MSPVPIAIPTSVQEVVQNDIIHKPIKPTTIVTTNQDVITNGSHTLMRPNNTSHPLDSLTREETRDFASGIYHLTSVISAISLAVRRYVVEHTTVKAIKFITCSTANPPKRDVLAFLGIPLATGEQPETLKNPIIRKADIDFIDLVTGDAYDAILVLNDGEWVMETLTKLPEGTQPQISVDELFAAENTVRKDPRVQKLAAEQGLKPENIYADGWSIGWDSRFPTKKRLQQALLFARFHEHDNLYAYPLDFIPVLDSNSLEVIHIDFPPHRTAKDEDGNPTLTADTTAPPSLTEDALQASGRGRIPYPNRPFEYLPEYREKQPGFKPSTREPLKPLQIVQPDGVSFKMNGQEIEWQNWKMHIAFNHREGIALSTITYNENGQLRPMIYRLSLVEMVVPYASPEHPHPRKFAFDVGEYGIGTQANDLTLGCDCLGKIHYLAYLTDPINKPGSFIGQDGTPFYIKRAICIHEEDNGLLWKHTDFRTGRAYSVRSRRLVISMICTVANYDGTIEFEVKLTGILNVYPLAEGETSTPFSTTVAPRVSAQYHQHLFSLRIDPMFDGLHNSVVESDVIAVSAPTESKENWAGNAFTTTSQTLRLAKEGGREYDFSKDRRWSIVNPNMKEHYASGRHPGYVLGYRGFATTLLAQPGSWVMKRAGFSTKSLWVVKDVENDVGGRMWPSGKYVPQTRSTPDDSVERWAEGDESIENEDIVLFATLGVNHITRPEDWPVMPVEHVRLTMRPINFFEQNPAIDVPGTQDVASILAFEEPSNTEEIHGTNGTNGTTSCCN
ncbi:hypothetical protein Clacol_008454 [Clathrus columnatus]|uniref:Amine oxidase n=1 Tax=Clathrus columnatus TaxID=1419009 RepID=A0AAV5AHS0_9AGAM|nr:hypothetical protein Clacol_008454 [Clathrus columnatus]